MLALVGPLVAAALIGQTDARDIRGQAVDEKRTPVAGAEIVFSAPIARPPAVVPTQTDAEGRFRLTTPRLGRANPLGAHVWAYQAGLAITAARMDAMPPALVLQKAAPRVVRLEGPDGKPIAGAHISPRVISFSGISGDPNPWLPEILFEPLAVTTDSDGRAAIAYLAARDHLVAVRVTADPIGTQVILITEGAGRGAPEKPITIRLKPTSRIIGRVVDGSGQPVRGQPVEVWFRGELGVPRCEIMPNRVEFQGGPPRTAADGSFQTPNNLFVGTPYRVVVRGPGLEPVLSHWITIGKEPQTLPPIVVRPLRSITGRVVDRQGRPVAGVEVFQSGDGPVRTTTKTDSDGRFSLGGFRQDTVFLFVRGENLRFHGQLVRAEESDFTIRLTRLSERPVRRMRMLPEPIPLEESRALARRLIEPYWKAAVAKDSDYAKRVALQALATADPAAMLERLETVRFLKDRLRRASSS